MTEKQIKERIAKMKAIERETWLSIEQFECPACGESFRYADNLSKHIKRCWDYKYGK
jgi:uncharacterized C2H2 Zn-finger protein